MGKARLAAEIPRLWEVAPFRLGFLFLFFGVFFLNFFFLVLLLLHANLDDGSQRRDSPFIDPLDPADQ